MSCWRGKLPEGQNSTTQDRGGTTGSTAGQQGPPVQAQQPQEPSRFYRAGRGPQFQNRAVVPSRPAQASQTPHAMPYDSPGKSLVESSAASLASLPRRPGQGVIGAKCIVKGNHFLTEFSYDLHQYDVTITPRLSPSMCRAVIWGLLVNDREPQLGKMLLPYNGGKILYTAGPLPFKIKMFNNVVLYDRRRKEHHTFNVLIKFAAHIDLYPTFLQDRHAPRVEQVSNNVLRELPSRYKTEGRLFYNLEKCCSLGNGLEFCRGFLQSVRSTQMGWSLNIDVASTIVFIKPLPVIEFASELLNKDITSIPLSHDDLAKITKALGGVEVEVTQSGRKYYISCLTAVATRELLFEDEDPRKTLMSDVDYFKKIYDVTVCNTHLPCLVTSLDDYLPMEVCKIVGGQRYSKRLSNKLTYQCPKDREQSIVQPVRDNAYAYAKEFGIKISDELAQVEARVLPAPRLMYHDESECQPEIRQWNMIDKKMYEGGRVDHWICVNFSSKVVDLVASGFCEALALMCRTLGMNFNPLPVQSPIRAEPDDVEIALKKLLPAQKKLDLLIVILPKYSESIYGDLKRICEIDLGIVSQCCLAKHVFKKKNEYLGNLALKINVKVGGRNTVLVDALSKCLISEELTIIFGADVTHPSNNSNPSIAAVVASQDWPGVTKYACLVSAQKPNQEIIQDLFNMVKQHLISFWDANAEYPSIIIFYRDGVGESQFHQVLQYELNAIQRACASLDPNYQPPVTFVVVQKRHHTRLFANNHNDPNTMDGTGNILPGTVVDSKICHPMEFDFYLCSHAGIRGTSRPAHYYVLWDDNNFTADGMQSLTNKLCYTFARCTRSVSIVPPVYYAHLAAYRARHYVELEPKSDSVANGAAGRGANVRPLRDIHENIQMVMFYC